MNLEQGARFSLTMAGRKESKHENNRQNVRKTPALYSQDLYVTTSELSTLH